MFKDKLILKTKRIEELKDAQVEEFISKEIYQNLKAQDPHPYFIELVVAHEGVSQGPAFTGVLGSSPCGSVRKFWSVERIKELVKKLKSQRVPIYLFHQSSGSSRKKVGEILGASLKKVNGLFSAIALGYVADPLVREKLRKKELDTCSLEAELVLEQVSESRGAVEWLVNAIERVSGLALGQRTVSQPGFPGAMVLAQVEEFEEESKEVWDWEKKLAQKDKELNQLKAELARYQAEKEQEERRKKVKELLGEYLKERNLKREERAHLEMEVSERIELKKPEQERIEEEVRRETELELERMLRLKRIYQERDALRSSVSREMMERRNPLIPKEEP